MHVCICEGGVSTRGVCVVCLPWEGMSVRGCGVRAALSLLLGIWNEVPFLSVGPPTSNPKGNGVDTCC